MRKPSNVSTFVSASDIVDEDSNNKEPAESIHLGGKSAPNGIIDERTTTAFGSEVDIPRKSNLIVPFNLKDTLPLTHGRRLSMPVTTNDWSIAVLEQRWYQTIGSKLRVDAAEFHNEALQGLEYLGAWGRTLNPENEVLHRWAMDIMREIESYVAEPEKAGKEDGSWKYPSAIVPEMIELLPLPLYKRIKYYGQVIVMFDEVVRQFNTIQLPCEAHGILRHQCVSQSCEKSMLRSTYLSKVLAGYEAFCWEVAEDVKTHFHDMYSQTEVKVIETAWQNRLECSRIEAKEEETERSRTLKQIGMGRQHNFGIFTGMEMIARNGSDNDWLGPKLSPFPTTLGPIKQFPFQPGPQIGFQRGQMGPVRLQRALPPLTILKPSKFNWADDEEENGMPEVESELKEPLIPPPSPDILWPSKSTQIDEDKEEMPELRSEMDEISESGTLVKWRNNS